MPRPRFPYLHKEIFRHGVVEWYVRRGKGKRTRINGDYGSAQFKTEYDEAIRGEQQANNAKASSESLSWLIARYRDSSAWAKLSPATRRQRENIFLHVMKTGGDKPFSEISRKTIAAGIDRRKATPFQAGNFLKAMRGLFQWAVKSDHMEIDPTQEVDAPAPRTEGFRVWTEEEIDRFEARWPVGTRERLALAILLYTGLRRGDAVKLGRQHVRDGVVMIRTEKTGIQIVIPVLPELSSVLSASKTGDLAFIATASGAPMTKESFGNWFREACNAAGVPGSAHGLRKAGATRAANNGAGVKQLEAIYGWTDGKMAALYTRQADRVRLAREAIGMLSRDEKENTYSRTSNPGAGENPENNERSIAYKSYGAQERTRTSTAFTTGT